MNFYIGLHHHNHGVDAHLFETSVEMTVTDYERWLGDSFEPDRGEHLDLDLVNPNKIEKENP